jgi:hypothetical protein
MTRKDYVLIAAALKEARHHFWAGRSDDNSQPPNFADGLQAAAEELALRLSNDNARFDRARFLTACGMSP